MPKLYDDGEKKIYCRFDEQIELTTLLSLKHPKNRNKHPKDQIKQLAKIMKENGVRHPIILSTLSGKMTKGHGRLEAALLNRWKVYPVEYQDYLTEEHEYADIQADNAIALWAELDLAQINDDLQHLGPDFDIDLLGIKNFLLEPADKETKPQICPHCGEELPSRKNTDKKR